VKVRARANSGIVALTRRGLACSARSGKLRAKRQFAEV
jgi:hypothetical protein